MHSKRFHTNELLGTGLKLLLLVALLLHSAIVSAVDPLRVGLFPRRPAAVTNAMFEPLVAHLAAQLGRPVSLDTPPDFRSFWQRLARGDYDLAHMNQYHYVKAHKEHGFNAIVSNQEGGSDTVTAALWVRNDSGIRSLNDLRGRVIVFGGGRGAMISHIVPRDLLQQAGIPDTNYLSRYTLHPVNAIESVYFGQSSAAGMGEAVASLAGTNQRIKRDQVSVLARSQPLTHLPWAVSMHLSRQDRVKITDALLALNHSSEGRAILQTAGLTGINPVSDHDFDQHRAIIQRVLGEEY